MVPVLYFAQVIDILLGYIDIGVMMQKPSSGKEKELRQHYKVGQGGEEGRREEVLQCVCVCVQARVDMRV